jgi:hypothetical protein
MLVCGLKGERIEALHPAAGILALVICVACAIAPIGAEEAPRLVPQMVGTWDVVQHMWPGPNSAPTALPAAIAVRHLVGDPLLQETMEAVPGSKQRFTRVANFGYNAVTRQWEYFTWDSRAPQMMSEKSRASVGSDRSSEQSTIRLYGGTFVAPLWGLMKNMAFRYRFTLGPIHDGRQFARLYLTPQSGPSEKEFLAYEYVYTKHRR